MPQRTQYFESAACCSAGRATSDRRDRSDAALVRLGHRRELRVVGVVDELRLRGQRRDRLAPALGDELELAVPVELIAEEIPEADRSRPEPSQELGQCALVDLEEPELRVAGAEQRRGDARDEIRARPVVREPVAAGGGSRPPSPSWSSCRSWPRRPPFPSRAARRGGRSRRGRARRGVCPGSSSRRRRRGVARAPPRRAQPRSRARVGDGRASGERSQGRACTGLLADSPTCSTHS